MSSAADVLDALDPEQRAVATALHGPVCVIAGAGTGKTRAITHRIAHGVLAGAFEPRRVLAVTFTTRAAGEMRARLRALGVDGVQARTFHSAALRQARYFWPQVMDREFPEITSSKLPLVGAAASRCRVGTDRTTLRDLAAEFEWAKVTNVAPDAYPQAAEAARREVAGVDPETVGRVYAAYEDVKTDRGLFDLEDILLAAVGLLAGRPVSRRRSARSTTMWSSTSTRTSRRFSRLCSISGSAAATTYASSATRRRRSTPSPAGGLTTSSASPNAIRGLRSSGWCGTTGPRRRWSTSPTAFLLAAVT